MKKTKTSPYSSGHILITLLVVSVVGIITSSAAVAWVINDGNTNYRVQQSVMAQSAAESGIESALLRILRDPSYSGEVLTIGDATVIISVTGQSEMTIVSQSSLGDFSQKIEVSASYNDSVLSINSWDEIS